MVLVDKGLPPAVRDKARLSVGLVSKKVAVPLSLDSSLVLSAVVPLSFNSLLVPLMAVPSMAPLMVLSLLGPRNLQLNIPITIVAPMAVAAQPAAVALPGSSLPHLEQLVSA